MSILKTKIPLLLKVVIAIVLGVGASFVMPEAVARVFITINSLFSSYLGFVIPLIILGLVAPSIADIGSSAKKLLLLTALIAYGSTVFAGYLSYAAAQLTYPELLAKGATQLDFVNPNNELLPFFTVDMPPLMGVTAALVMAFILGLTLAGFKNNTSTLKTILDEFKEIITLVINRSIIPLLPLYIFGIFLELGVEGQVVSVLGLFVKIIIVIFALHILLLLVQFIIAGAVAKRNPFKALAKMLPAYATALGTQSSAATIPVTLNCVKRNGVRSDIAQFTVPLCATIHLSGSMLKIVACALAIAWMTDMPINLELYTGFILALGVTMIAAPGVPGGAIMAALALLSSQLGFGEVQIGLMIALYIAMDSFGTACNVTGDGAIAMVVNAISKTKD